MLTAIGRIAGPLNPPTKLPIADLLVVVFITSPVKVLIMLRPSAPASSAAFAITVISPTFGVSFAITGKFDIFFTAFTVLYVASGSCETNDFFFKFGHERFSSIADKPVGLLSFSAII